MKYNVRIGHQTIGPMSREDVLRHASNWQNGSLPVTVAPEGTQNFVPLGQFIASTQSLNPPPPSSASLSPPPIFGQSAHQPQQAQPLPSNAQTSYQQWQQAPPQPQAPLPWQQPVSSRTGSASKSRAPFVALAIGGAAIVIVALLITAGLISQRKQSELVRQMIEAQQQEEEEQREWQEEQQRMAADAMAALDDADRTLQAVENEARSAPGDFSSDFQQLRSAIVAARQSVSQGGGQGNAGLIKTQIQQVREKVTRAIDDARAKEEFNRVKEALLDRMRATAQAAAENKHPFTKEENTIQGEEKITYQSDTRVDFTISFDCRRVGSILGRDRFSVGVEVSGRLERAEKGWEGYVLGSHIIFDVKM